MSEVRFGGWSGIESRRHRRVPLQIPLECRRGQQAVHAKTENISVSGMLARCDAPFEQDEEVLLSFTLPGSGLVVSTRARVAHIVPGIFAGLEFTGLSTEGRAEVERFVASTGPTTHSG